MPSPINNMHGILAMLASMAGLILNDMLIKLASDSLPTGEIIFIRGVFSSLLMFGIVMIDGALADLRPAFNKPVFWRTVGEVTATGFYLTALFSLPIANATAIIQVVPLAVTAGAALFFREAVGWRRWSAVLIGFVGVLIIVRPGLEGFTIYSLFAFSSVLCIALRDLATREIPAAIRNSAVTLITSCAVTVLGLAMGLIEDWVMPSATTIGLLAGASFLILVGYFGAIVSLRVGEISVVAPFRYSIVVWSLIIGYVVWGDVPDFLVLTGTIIVVATGLYTFFRERRAVQ